MTNQRPASEINGQTLTAFAVASALLGAALISYQFRGPDKQEQPERLVSHQSSRPDQPDSRDRPLHEAQILAAWEAWERQDYAQAIKHADECIEAFAGTAKRRQAELDGAEIPVGVVKPADRAAIFANGPLNDCATAYYIQGRAAFKLGKRDLGVQSLALATKFPAARTWDPGGWFWSPAEAAQLYLIDPTVADKAPHEVYTANAWAAFNAGRDAQAIHIAQKCIDQFHAQALELERDLVRRKVKLPEGAVSKAMKQQIFQTGPLADVGTCFFIQGRAAERLGDTKAAAATYLLGSRLTQARCFDPRGWFWSTALACSDRLERLR